MDAAIIIGLMLTAWAWPSIKRHVMFPIFRFAVFALAGDMDKHQPPDDELEGIGGLVHNPRQTTYPRGWTPDRYASWCRWMRIHRKTLVSSRAPHEKPLIDT